MQALEQHALDNVERAFKVAYHKGPDVPGRKNYSDDPSKSCTEPLTTYEEHMPAHFPQAEYEVWKAEVEYERIANRNPKDERALETAKLAVFKAMRERQAWYREADSDNFGPKDNRDAYMVGNQAHQPAEKLKAQLGGFEDCQSFGDHFNFPKDANGKRVPPPTRTELCQLLQAHGLWQLDENGELNRVTQRAVAFWQGRLHAKVRTVCKNCPSSSQGARLLGLPAFKPVAAPVIYMDSDWVYDAAQFEVSGLTLPDQRRAYPGPFRLNCGSKSEELNTVFRFIRGNDAADCIETEETAHIRPTSDTNWVLASEFLLGSIPHGIEAGKIIKEQHMKKLRGTHSMDARSYDNEHFQQNYEFDLRLTNGYLSGPMPGDLYGLFSRTDCYAMTEALIQNQSLKVSFFSGPRHLPDELIPAQAIPHETLANMLSGTSASSSVLHPSDGLKLGGKAGEIHWETICHNGRSHLPEVVESCLPAGIKHGVPVDVQEEIETFMRSRAYNPSRRETLCFVAGAINMLKRPDKLREFWDLHADLATLCSKYAGRFPEHVITEMATSIARTHYLEGISQSQGGRETLLGSDQRYGAGLKKFRTAAEALGKGRLPEEFTCIRHQRVVENDIPPRERQTTDQQYRETGSRVMLFRCVPPPALNSSDLALYRKILGRYVYQDTEELYQKTLDDLESHQHASPELAHEWICRRTNRGLRGTFERVHGDRATQMARMSEQRIVIPETNQGPNGFYVQELLARRASLPHRVSQMDIAVSAELYTAGPETHPSEAMMHNVQFLGLYRGRNTFLHPNPRSRYCAIAGYIAGKDRTIIWSIYPSLVPAVYIRAPNRGTLGPLGPVATRRWHFSGRMTLLQKMFTDRCNLVLHLEQDSFLYNTFWNLQSEMDAEYQNRCGHRWSSYNGLLHGLFNTLDTMGVPRPYSRHFPPGHRTWGHHSAFPGSEQTHSCRRAMSYFRYYIYCLFVDMTMCVPAVPIIPITEQPMHKWLSSDACQVFVRCALNIVRGPCHVATFAGEKGVCGLGVESELGCKLLQFLPAGMLDPGNACLVTMWQLLKDQGLTYVLNSFKIQENELGNQFETWLAQIYFLLIRGMQLAILNRQRQEKGEPPVSELPDGYRVINPQLDKHEGDSWVNTEELRWRAFGEFPKKFSKAEEEYVLAQVKIALEPWEGYKQCGLHRCEAYKWLEVSENPHEFVRQYVTGVYWTRTGPDVDDTFRSAVKPDLRAANQGINNATLEELTKKRTIMFISTADWRVCGAARCAWAESICNYNRIFNVPNVPQYEVPEGTKDFLRAYMAGKMWNPITHEVADFPNWEPLTAPRYLHFPARVKDQDWTSGHAYYADLVGYQNNGIAQLVQELAMQSPLIDYGALTLDEVDPARAAATLRRAVLTSYADRTRLEGTMKQEVVDAHISQIHEAIYAVQSVPNHGQSPRYYGGELSPWNEDYNPVRMPKLAYEVEEPRHLDSDDSDGDDADGPDDSGSGQDDDSDGDEPDGPPDPDLLSASEGSKATPPTDKRPRKRARLSSTSNGHRRGRYSRASKRSELKLNLAQTRDERDLEGSDASFVSAEEIKDLSLADLPNLLQCPESPIQQDLEDCTSSSCAGHSKQGIIFTDNLRLWPANGGSTKPIMRECVQNFLTELRYDSATNLAGDAFCRDEVASGGEVPVIDDTSAKLQNLKQATKGFVDALQDFLGQWPPASPESVQSAPAAPIDELPRHHPTTYAYLRELEDLIGPMLDRDDPSLRDLELRLNKAGFHARESQALAACQQFKQEVNAGFSKFQRTVYGNLKGSHLAEADVSTTMNDESLPSESKWLPCDQGLSFQATPEKPKKKVSWSCPARQGPEASLSPQSETSKYEADPEKYPSPEHWPRVEKVATPQRRRSSQRGETEPTADTECADSFEQTDFAPPLTVRFDPQILDQYLSLQRRFLRNIELPSHLQYALNFSAEGPESKLTLGTQYIVRLLDCFNWVEQLLDGYNNKQRLLGHANILGYFNTRTQAVFEVAESRHRPLPQAMAERRQYKGSMLHETFVLRRLFDVHQSSIQGVQEHWQNPNLHCPDIDPSLLNLVRLKTFLWPRRTMGNSSNWWLLDGQFNKGFLSALYALSHCGEDPDQFDEHRAPRDLLGWGPRVCGLPNCIGRVALDAWTQQYYTCVVESQFGIPMMSFAQAVREFSKAVETADTGHAGYLEIWLAQRRKATQVSTNSDSQPGHPTSGLEEVAEATPWTTYWMQIFEKHSSLLNGLSNDSPDAEVTYRDQTLSVIEGDQPPRLDLSHSRSWVMSIVGPKHERPLRMRGMMAFELITFSALRSKFELWPEEANVDMPYVLASSAFTKNWYALQHSMEWNDAIQQALTIRERKLQAERFPVKPSTVALEQEIKTYWRNFLSTQANFVEQGKFLLLYLVYRASRQPYSDEKPWGAGWPGSKPPVTLDDVRQGIRRLFRVFFLMDTTSGPGYRAVFKDSELTRKGTRRGSNSTHWDPNYHFEAGYGLDANMGIFDICHYDFENVPDLIMRILNMAALCFPEEQISEALTLEEVEILVERQLKKKRSQQRNASKYERVK